MLGAFSNDLDWSINRRVWSNSRELPLVGHRKRFSSNKNGLEKLGGQRVLTHQSAVCLTPPYSFSTLEIKTCKQT